MKKFFLLFALFFAELFFAQPTPYVLLVSFDGFRWDYLDRNITPNLDSVISNGARAVSLRPVTPSKTFPNHYSIISGMYAENHGIIFNSFEDTHSCDYYRIGDTNAVRNPKWYKGEAFWETAEKNGITTASYFWPGSEMNDPKRRPSYFKNYNHDEPYKNRIDGVVDWLQMPYHERPHFITLYFHDTDTYGHAFGPNSPEINTSIQRLDSLVGYLDNELTSIGMRDSINIIYLSDHGMTEIDTSRTINLEIILDGLDYKSGGSKPLVMIEPHSEDFDSVYQRVIRNEDHFTVYKKSEVPDHFHFKNNENIYSIILAADLGWSFVDGNQFDEMRKYGNKGDHGYLKEHLDMHGILVASGPRFKNSYKIGTLWNIDVYPLLCKIFNIYPNPKIDGKLERIEY
ncbi:MAG: ectonucleotide pyrophosphatase/phosphodiesterase, partial [Bacteroidota bacterium]